MMALCLKKKSHSEKREWLCFKDENIRLCHGRMDKMHCSLHWTCVLTFARRARKETETCVALCDKDISYGGSYPDLCDLLCRSNGRVTSLSSSAQPVHKL